MAAKHRAKRHGRRSSPRLLRRLTRGPTLLAIAVVGAIAAFVALVVISSATTGGGKIERIQQISAEGRTRGSATAPVTVIEFADFQCPACKRFAETTGNELEEVYIATGQVRLEFRNMAFLGPESVLAAEAAACANDQGKFWEYHDRLFEGQQGENRGAFSSERLVHFAREVGLDEAKFITCMESERYKQMVLDETEAGREAGVDSTPTFFVNGELVRNVQSFEELQQIIDQKLEEAAQSP